MSQWHPWGGIEPWEWHWAYTLVAVFLMALSIGAAWVWTRAGRDRLIDVDDRIGERVEDYGGVIRAARGRVPLFLWLLYAAAAAAAVGYIVAVITAGYGY